MISEKLYKEKSENVPIRKTSLKLRIFTHQKVPLVGKIDVLVCYKGQEERMPLYIVKGNGPVLLGRNWLTKIQLDWPQMKLISTDSDEKLQKVLSKYTVFDNKLGTVEGVQAKLIMKKDVDTKFFKSRPVPYALKGEIDKELKRLVTNGILEKVEYSDWASPIVPVLKPDGSVRICGDYKVTINPLLDTPEHPMPNPEEIYSQLCGGKKFTKLDLSQAYQQILLEEDSRKYVTINTHLGLFRYTRLPYGVNSAPAVFQSVMDKILAGLPVGCYLDDMIITGANDDDHLHNLEKVLQRLEQYNIKLKKTKCQFMKSSIKFLGHVVNSEGISPSEDTVQDILSAPAPSNISTLQSFLGLVNYYRKYIPNLSTMIAPLNRLLGKKVKWNWDKECESRFEQSKDVMASAELLTHYDSNKPVVLAVDASPYGLGAVISHSDSKNEKPIAYASRSLTAAEKHYSQIEKEALAIISGPCEFHQYLFG